jgi:membrane protein DedA with SNARE-associated domain
LLASYSFILFYLYKIGPFFLFLALVLGIVGLPFPDELLLVGAGYLVAHQKLNLFVTVFFALAGSICGITISYLLGRLIGNWIVKKYGTTLNLTEKKIATAQGWFAQIGKWILVVGYFIPLFRHLVGFVAGGSKLGYKDFALFAYSGAVIWCATFLGIGYFFHPFVARLFGK